MLEEDENKHDIPPQKSYKKSKKKYAIILFIFLIVGLIVLSASTDIFTRWFIPDNQEPVINLNHPDDFDIFNVNTTYFNWTSTDADGDILYHVWYCDALNTFTSPFYRNTNTNTTHNYTALPFMDGDYYWRVEVTDNKSVVVSSTRQFTILTDALNTFPNVTDPELSPSTGYEDTIFTYEITYADADNDVADYVRICIDGIIYNMTESLVGDTNTINGKKYTYSTTLSSGLHTYQFTCSDGTAINLTAKYSGPLVTAGSTPTEEEVIPTPHIPKMNKVTLSPKNYETHPSGIFTGTITITEENINIPYEVYWYLFLVDENNQEVSYISGAVAIHTTVTLAYELSVSIDTIPGVYKLLARTYDGPKEQPSSNQLGMDEKSVTITELPTILGVIEEGKENSFVFPVLIMIFIVLLFLLIWLKRSYLAALLAGLGMLILVILEIINNHILIVPSILLVVVGVLLLTKYYIVFRIKNPNVAKLIGIVLVLFGFILYSGVIV